MRGDRDGMGRRDFLKVGGTAVLGASAVRAAEVEAQTTGSQAAAPTFIIDSHNHFDNSQQWVDEMVRTYRAHRAMVCTNGFMSDFEAMRNAASAHPDVFIPFGRVAPDDPNAVRELARFHDAGFLGVKLHSPQKDWDDPAYFQIYRLCEQFGMHILLHTGISSRPNIDETPRWGTPGRMRPMSLDLLARQFPKATIQGAHFGNPWYEEAAEAMRWNPNLFFDASGSTLYKLIKLNKLDRLGEALWWADWPEGQTNPHTLGTGPRAWEHIVFGVDEGPSGLVGNIQRYQQMMDVNKVRPADRESIWGLTMARILKIDPKTRRRIGPKS